VHFLTRWKLAVVAVMTAVALALTAGTALAAMPGEGGIWTAVGYIQPGGGQGTLESADVPSEADNQGHQVHVWEAADASGNIWFNYDDGNPFQIPGGGVTHQAPEVVPFGTFGFAAFHRGNDSHIYVASSGTGRPGSWTSWTQLSDTTPFSPSVARINGGGSELYMVYRSNDAQRTIYGRYFNGSIWSSPEWLGGTTDYAPSIAWSAASQRYFIVHTGTDDHVYINNAPYGSDPNPNGWTSLGGIVNGPPSIAASTGSRMLVGAAVRATGDTWYTELLSGGGQLPFGQPGVWHEDSAHQFALNAVRVFAIGVNFYAFIVNRQNNGYPLLAVLAKPVWNGS